MRLYIAAGLDNIRVIQVIKLSGAALILSYLSVILIRRWTEGRHILDIPNNRSSHTRPIPRGGGIAIVAITLCGLIAYAWLTPLAPWPMLIAYLIGSLLIAAVSWLDDLRAIPPWARFVTHSAAAILAIGSFGYLPINLTNIPLIGEANLGWVGLLITFLWIVGLTNAYNFMDGIDGIAGSQAVVAGLGWAVLGYFSGQLLVFVLGVLLAVSSLGFLIHNWPPARIFMGDVGSAFLGYSFAILLVIAVQAEPNLKLAGILMLWPFLFDTSLTLFRRLIRCENIFNAHRSHLYQRLVITGATHRQVTLVYVGLACAGTLLSLGWAMDNMLSPPLSVLLIALFCFALWFYVVQQERKSAIRN